MAILTRPVADVDFIITMQDGHLSVENGVLSSGQNLPAGTILQASGDELVALDGNLTTAGAVVTAAKGILMYSTDATDADQAIAYVARLAEVNGRALSFPTESTAGGEKAAAIASLAALDIIVRE